jgi:hypothetical protein
MQFIFFLLRLRFFQFLLDLFQAPPQETAAQSASYDVFVTDGD